MSYMEEYEDDPEDLNETRDSFFETPTKSKSGTLLTSTPRSTKNNRPKKSLFRAPEAPMNILSCNKCPKKFRTERTLKQHLRSHELKDAAACSISKDKVEGAFSSSLNQVLSDMIKSSGTTHAYANFISSVKEELHSSPDLKNFMEKNCAVLCKGLLEKSYVMPSAMWTGVLGCVNVSINDPETRSVLKEHLLCFQRDCPSEIVCPFVTEFSHKMGAAVTSMITRGIAEAAGAQFSEARVARSADDFSTDRDKTTAFHIFGFVVKHFWVKALQSCKSAYWKEILGTITTRFVKGGLAPNCAESIELWTASIDRGGLTYVSEHAFNFFIALAPILQGMEERNGSLGHEAVLAKVCNTPSLISLWDTVVGNSLTEADSLTFLTSVVKSVTNVVGVGIRDRRLNAEMSKGSVNVALRSSLGPKKSAGQSKK